ncbi:MAG: hypothetical protein ABI383_12860 [Acidobacteriaceae bacterium]
MTLPHIGRPQIFAALLLLLFFFQGLWLLNNKPAAPQDYSRLDCGRSLLHIYPQGTCQSDDSPLAASAAAAPFFVMRSIGVGEAKTKTSALSEWDLFRFAPWTTSASRLPFLFFGVWLGGGLWWVAKRLFGAAGGIVALALYCTSPLLISAASIISPEIIAAWGFFGAIYTAIGIGHTLLAPVREWRLRILLLGAALGLTAAAVPVAALVAFAFCVFFVLYLAPGRRWHALAVLIASSLFAIIIALLCAGPRWQLLIASSPRLSAAWILRFFSQAHNIPLYSLAAVALATFLGWRRARYFGNWTPLLVAAVAPFVAVRWTSLEPLVWALPFLFVFTGGIFADLFESKLRRPAVVIAVLLIAAQGWLGWNTLQRSVEVLKTVGGH